MAKKQKKPREKTDTEYAIAIVEAGPNALLTRPEAIALVFRGIELGRSLRTIQPLDSKGPGEPDGDPE